VFDISRRANCAPKVWFELLRIEQLPVNGPLHHDSAFRGITPNADISGLGSAEWKFSPSVRVAVLSEIGLSRTKSTTGWDPVSQANTHLGIF
jgi:hypothetical protein